MFETWVASLAVVVAIGAGAYHLVSGNSVSQFLTFVAVLVVSTAMQYDCVYHVAASTSVLPGWFMSSARNIALGCLTCRLVAAIVSWRPAPGIRIRDAGSLLKRPVAAT